MVISFVSNKNKKNFDTMALPASPTLSACAAQPQIIADIACAPNTIPGYFDRLVIRDSAFDSGDTTTDFAAAIDNAAAIGAGVARILPIFDFKQETTAAPVDTVEDGAEIPAGKPKLKFTFRTSNFDNYDAFIRALGHNKPFFFWLVNSSKVMGGEVSWQDGISGVLSCTPVVEGKGTVTKWELSFSKEMQFLPSYVATPAGIY